MNWFERKSPAYWPKYRVAPHLSGKWAVEYLDEEIWQIAASRLDLDSAKGLCIHMMQGPIYPPFNPDHS